MIITSSFRFWITVFWTFGALASSLWPVSTASVIYAGFTLFVVGSWVNPKSSIHMMYFLGFVTFLYLPALLNWFFLNVECTYFFLTSFLSVLFLTFTKGINFKSNYKVSNVSVMFFFVFSFFLLLSFLIGLGSILAPVFPFFIMLMVLSFEQGKKVKNIGLFLLFFTVFIAYALTSWSGFGRVVVMSWLAVGALYLAYSINFRVNKYLFGILPGLSVTALTGRDLLALSFNGFEAALYDSSFGPYRLASSFIEKFNEHELDLAGFFDQIIFTLFVYVPRELWVTKPYGFGFEYVVRHMSSSLIEAGHSIAPLLVGEHIYFLGYWGIITGIFVLYIIGLLSRTLYKLKGLNGYGVILFSASMPVLVWGGMTSFSARVALPSIIFFVFYITLSQILTKNFVLKK